jgi:hypothetical protein
LKGNPEGVAFLILKNKNFLEKMESASGASRSRRLVARRERWGSSRAGLLGSLMNGNPN